MAETISLECANPWVVRGGTGSTNPGDSVMNVLTEGSLRFCNFIKPIVIGQLSVLRTEVSRTAGSGVRGLSKQFLIVG